MKRVKGQPLPLGITIRGEETNFSIVVPKRKQCRLLLYKAGEIKPCFTYAMEDAVGEVCYLALQGLDLDAYEYNYEIDGEVVADPYGKMFTGRAEWKGESELRKHEVRGVLYHQEYDWEGDVSPNYPYEEVISYSLHVRGFTKDSYSGVKHKGTFEGIVEKIPYLKELGINQIQCMPVYEFEERGRVCNYWGYGPAYYFAPKSAYSASGDGVKSLKDMVKACHKAGIEVVLEMPFEPDVPVLTVIECLRYYKMEYHVDGFILNPCAQSTYAAAEDPVLKQGGIMMRKPEFQNVMRRFLKGDEGMVNDVIYWLRHRGDEEGTFNYITAHNGFTLKDLVSYDGKHNEANGENNQDGPDYNFSWNCGAEGPSRKKAVVELRKRQTRNALFLMLLAQGMPCLLSGDEFGNSQNGNNNVYCQDNPTGWLNWRNSKESRELTEFVKELIQLRKTYRAFRPEREMCGTDVVGCGVPDVSYHGENAWRTPCEVSSRQLGVYYSGAAYQEEDCFVIYNMHWLSHTFALPSLKNGKKWYRIASTDAGVMKEPILLKEQKYLEAEARTIVVLVSR